MLRKIIKINEDKCNGCGLCIPKCHEGAIQLINGKARLISEFMCDGLGACLGHCPEDAIRIEEREAEPYDEKKVMLQLASTDKETIKAHLEHLKDHGENAYLNEACATLKENKALFKFDTTELISSFTDVSGAKNSKPEISMFRDFPKPMHTGCPGTASKKLVNNPRQQASRPVNKGVSALTHWPVQLHLINPVAPHYRESDLLIAADCTAYTIPGFHEQFLQGKTLAIACPKLDQGLQVYHDKLVRLIDEAEIKSITVLVMKVPCCGGLGRLVSSALATAEREVNATIQTIDFDGSVIDTKEFINTRKV